MKFLLGSLLLGLFMYSCTPSDIEETTLNFYTNSFETTSDTLGWSGNCWVDFCDDAPIDGGEQSIFVSCGCVVPHVTFLTEPTVQNGRYVISCQAKGADLGGSISLKWDDSEVFIGISGQDSTWQFFQSTDTLFCPIGEKMEVHLSAGGFASGSITVDLLEIKMVN